MSDDMQEIGDGLATTTISVKEAAASLARMERFDDGLRRRTEGTLWMVWGLVFAAIFVSFYAYTHSGPQGTPHGAGQVAIAVFAPWVGWVIAGGAISAAVWRSAALHDPLIAASRRALRNFLVMVGAIAFALTSVFLSWVVGDALGIAVGNSVNPLTVIGVVSLLLAWLNPLRLTRLGRNVALATGALQVASGVVFAVLSSPGPYPDAAVVMGIACGASWIAGGLYETLRG